jgi:plastocyanin
VRLAEIHQQDDRWSSSVDSEARGANGRVKERASAVRTVTWAWNAAGSHLIQATGIPPLVFLNSVVMSASSSTYSVTFHNPGTYTYDCGVHGAAMSGRIVVQ